jgi:hypothetical protein
VARRRLAELKSELVTVKRASALFAERAVVRPKELCGIAATLAAEGHGSKRTCRIIGLAPSTFFRWKHVPPSSRSIRRAWLTDVIGEIHLRSRGTYGNRRVRAELTDAHGQIVNKKLIRSIMVELGISELPKRRRGKPTPLHQLTTDDLVNRDFRRDGPNQLWMTDISTTTIIAIRGLDFIPPPMCTTAGPKPSENNAASSFSTPTPSIPNDSSARSRPHRLSRQSSGSINPQRRPPTH